MKPSYEIIKNNWTAQADFALGPCLKCFTCSSAMSMDPSIRDRNQLFLKQDVLFSSVFAKSISGEIFVTANDQHWSNRLSVCQTGKNSNSSPKLAGYFGGR